MNPEDLIGNVEEVMRDLGIEMPDIEQPEPEPEPENDTGRFTVDDILGGKPFYSDKKNPKGLLIGIPVALKEALDYAGETGIVATMPELIKAKIKANKSHKFWQKWYTVQTEEDIGIDKKGTYVARGKPVLLVVHGGGLLTPTRIEQAYDEGLINNSAKYAEKEFNELLEGKLPTGDVIKICTLDEIKRGIELPRRHAIALDYEAIQKTISEYHDKTSFLQNHLVIARTSGVINLESYFDKAKRSDGTLGNYHPFAERSASQAQGRLLILDDYDGLYGSSNLNDSGRFVGVVAKNA